MDYCIDFEDVASAAERIEPFVHRTPVMTSHMLDGVVGSRVLFKCESLQRVGAFKFRGACNAVFGLCEDEASRGVVTHSSGNHAQALALASTLRGVPAHIVMPTNAPKVKRAAGRAYGGTIHDCEPTQEAREDGAAAIVQERGAVFIHPNNDPRVMAGQGTCAVELLRQAGKCDERGTDKPSLDAIVAPIGGGGLMSGICIAAKHLSPGTKLIGAEPDAADDAARSLTAGTLVRNAAPPDTIADGLRTNLGDNNWPILRDHIETIITVDEDAIVRAMRFVWERMKLIIEPSAAVAVAAVFDHRFAQMNDVQRVGVILSGGNVDLDRLPWASDA